MRSAVFLDRDGVLNRALVRDGRPYSPRRLEELEIMPGVREGMVRLKAADWLLIVVTNQPDVARGIVTRREVDAINERLCRELPIDAVHVCFHDTLDGCECRKPKPGLLLQAAADYPLNMSRSFMVGDRWVDVAAGQAAGTRTIFLDNRYSEQRPESYDYVAGNFGEVTEIVLAAMGE